MRNGSKKPGQEFSPFQSGRSRVLSPAGAWAVAELTPEREGKAQMGQELSREGNEPSKVLFHSLMSPTLMAQCALAHEECEECTQTAKPEGAARMESCYQQVNSVGLIT